MRNSLWHQLSAAEKGENIIQTKTWVNITLVKTLPRPQTSESITHTCFRELCWAQTPGFSQWKYILCLKLQKNSQFKVKNVLELLNGLFSIVAFMWKEISDRHLDHWCYCLKQKRWTLLCEMLQQAVTTAVPLWTQLGCKNKRKVLILGSKPCKAVLLLWFRAVVPSPQSMDWYRTVG